MSVASLDRLVQFARTRSVTHVLGSHVEMSNRPGRDLPMGAPRLVLRSLAQRLRRR